MSFVYDESTFLFLSLLLSKAQRKHRTNIRKKMKQKTEEEVKSKIKQEEETFNGESRDVYKIKSYTTHELDLNKKYYDEEELHPNKKMEVNVMELVNFFFAHVSA